MTEQHPITPSRELAQQWTDQIYGGPGAVVGSDDLCLAKLAAQWGADTELEACCEWLGKPCPSYARELRAARRPKPPSLKEQALKMLRPLSNPIMPGTPEYRLYEPQAEIIRRALEALPDD
jgi:hypothetical protein